MYGDIIGARTKEQRKPRKDGNKMKNTINHDLDYELVVIWDNGDKNVYEYATEEKAEEGAERMKMAFGHQIAWTGTRRKI